MTGATTQLEYLEQALEASDRDLAACRRQAADREAEVTRERDDARAALDLVCERLTGEREARRGLAKDLGRTNNQLQAARNTIQELRVVELKARLLLIAVEEGSDLQVVDAGRELRKALPRVHSR